MLRLPLSLGALFLATTAFATPPAAPQVTIGASNVKQLRLDWEIVPRSNYYEVWFIANNGAAPVKFGERQPWNPHWVQNVSVHLLNWSEARWMIKACNPSGCTSSGPVYINSAIESAIGFFKPPLARKDAKFGNLTAISEDGKDRYDLHRKDLRVSPHERRVASRVELRAFPDRRHQPIPKGGHQWRRQSTRGRPVR